MPPRSRLVVIWVICLGVLVMLVGLARLVPTRQRKTSPFTCSCEGPEKPYTAYRWLSRGVSNTVYALGQIKRFLAGKEMDLCVEEQQLGILVWLFGKKKPKEKGLLASSVCDIHRLIVMVKPPLAAAPARRWLASVRELGLWATLSLTAGSTLTALRHAWTTFVDVPGRITSETPTSVSTRHPFVLVWNIPIWADYTSVLIIGGCLWMAVFLVVKLSPHSYKTIQKVFRRRRGIKKTFLKAFAAKYVAVSLIKTGKNFHTFHMLSKVTGKEVFLKCNRRDATKVSRTGLAKAYRATMALKHRHIVAFVDWITYGSSHGLVLEFAAFGCLKDAFPAEVRFLSVLERLAVFKQVVSAVAFLHNADAAHLNVRPGSVLVFNKWTRLKLSGFTHVVRVPPKGICNQYELHPMASPGEVLTNKPYDAFKADIWALGSLLFFIIVGDFFQKETDIPVNTIILEAVRGSDITHKRTILGLLARLLSCEPQQRPTLGEIQDCMEGINNIL